MVVLIEAFDGRVLDGAVRDDVLWDRLNASDQRRSDIPQDWKSTRCADPARAHEYGLHGSISRRRVGRRPLHLRTRRDLRGTAIAARAAICPFGIRIGCVADPSRAVMRNLGANPYRILASARQPDIQVSGAHLPLDHIGPTSAASCTLNIG